MSNKQVYRGFVIDACPRRLSGRTEWTADFYIQKHDDAGVAETQFFLGVTHPSAKLAVEAALQAARRTIDRGFRVQPYHNGPSPIVSTAQVDRTR